MESSFPEMKKFKLRFNVDANDCVIFFDETTEYFFDVNVDANDYGVFLIYGAHTPINLLKDLIEFNFKNDLKVSHN